MWSWRVIGSTVAASALTALGLVMGVLVPDSGPLLGLSLIAVPAVVTGWVVVRHHRGSAVGPAIAWSSTCLVVVSIADRLALSAGTADPLPLSGLVRYFAVGWWPVNLVGFLVLLLVFPSGWPPGRRWILVPVIYAVATGLLIWGMWDAEVVDGVVAGGPTGPLTGIAVVLALAMIAGCLLAAVVGVVRRYRGGDEVRREQLRWLLWAGAAVVLSLMAGWVLNTLGARLVIAYLPFTAGIAVLVPIAVAIAIIRHDLYDIDRLLGESTTVVVVAGVSAAVFAALTFVLDQAIGLAGPSGSAIAGFTTAMVAVPLYRACSALLVRVIDHDRHVAVATARTFAEDVSVGRREPEEVGDVLRAAHRDPGLRLWLRLPDGAWRSPDGRERRPAAAEQNPATIWVRVRGETVAQLVPRRTGGRAERRLGELARAVVGPIEVCRLRAGLRAALAENQAGQARLAALTAEERRTWERDLHDGAQQRLVALGLRIRRLQQQAPGALASELEVVVDEVRACVAELRRLAQGVRPSRLDDGLAAALTAVGATVPVPFRLDVPDDLPRYDEARTLTAYLIVAEAVANALKHADPGAIGVRVECRGDRMEIEVSDDGRGGLPPDAALPALRDRVRSVNGTLDVDSSPGAGTRIRAVI